MTSMEDLVATRTPSGHAGAPPGGRTSVSTYPETHKGIGDIYMFLNITYRTI
jgi:hypothetical protein